MPKIIIRGVSGCDLMGQPQISTVEIHTTTETPTFTIVSTASAAQAAAPPTFGVIVDWDRA